MAGLMEKIKKMLGMGGKEKAQTETPVEEQAE